jgi:phage terminase small subunit
MDSKDVTVMALSPKHRIFCEEYLRGWNATDAYQVAYPKTNRDAARASAARLLADASIAAEIQQRINERAMSAHEVLDRLAEHARADYADFIVVNEAGEIVLDMDKAQGKTHLIKRVTSRRTIRTLKDAEIDETTISIELHDAQAALVQLGKHHKLFTDNVQHSGEVTIVKGYVSVSPDSWEKDKNDG